MGICEIDGSTTYVDALLLAARTAVTNGAATVGAITSGSANGKAFTKAVDLNPAEVLQACIRAKRLYGDTESPQVVVPDFSRHLGGC